MKKLRRVNSEWYSITITEDKWDLAVDVVAIFHTKWGEWSVCDGQLKFARRIDDYNRYVFVKLSSAKAFAKDLAIAIQNETIYPSILNYGE